MHGETQAHGMVSHSHGHILYAHAQAQAVQKFETGTHSHFEPAPKCTVAQQRGTHTNKRTTPHWSLNKLIHRMGWLWDHGVLKVLKTHPRVLGKKVKTSER